jgi:uracil-DNA glycosylase
MLSEESTAGDALAHISLKARAIGSPFIPTLTDLQANLTRHGFLLLNATLVYRAHVAPLKDAKAWRPFLEVVLEALAQRSGQVEALPTLVLWGKIAEQLNGLASSTQFPRSVSEHPYNLSFIGNRAMQELFGPMHLLLKQG